MPISRLTAIAIQQGGDDIRCSAMVSHGHEDGRKYAGCINLWRDNRLQVSPLVATAYAFPNREAAIEAVRRIVRYVRSRGDAIYMNTPTRAIVVPFAMTRHPDATSISLVAVGHATYVANTEQWQGVTKAVYVPVGSVVDASRPEFSRLGAEGPHQVKPSKIRGVVSSGLMVAVPDDTPLREDWTEKLGVILPGNEVAAIEGDQNL